LDAWIEEWRWPIATALLGFALAGFGLYLVTNGDRLGGTQPARLPSVASPLPFEEVAGQQTPTGPININTASQEELESLPGIGPTIARRIIDYRTQHGPFKKKEDLLKVKGIGPKTFADLQEKISLQ
jgi:comEA protein